MEDSSDGSEIAESIVEDLTQEHKEVEEEDLKEEIKEDVEDSSESSTSSESDATIEEHVIEDSSESSTSSKSDAPIEEHVVEDSSESSTSSKSDATIEEHVVEEPTIEETVPGPDPVTELASHHLRRPASAKPSLKRKDDTETAKQPNTWNILEVLCWIDGIGFHQYRKKFLHHAVDGKLLLQLTEQELKSDLGIGPLGHRYSILSAINELKQGTSLLELKTSSLRNNRPRSAPATTKQQAEGLKTGSTDLRRQRAQLENAINKTQAEITRNKSRVQQLSETINHDEERLRSLYQSLSVLDSTIQKANHPDQLALDRQGKVPWFPVGEMTATRKAHPERRGSLRDLAHVDETFHPQINNTSTLLIENSRVHRKTFLDRLHEDITMRTRKQQELEQKTSKRPGTEASSEEVLKDVEVVRQFLSTLNVEELPSSVEDLATRLNEELDLDQVQDELELSENEINRLSKAKGAKKVSFLAGAIRTRNFMQNYKLELENRDSRLRDLQKKWLQETLKLPDNVEQMRKDLSELQEYVGHLGWNEDSISDDDIDALINRVLHLKESKEKNQEPVWSNFKDGLAEMQKTVSVKSAEMEKEDITLESTIHLLSGLTRNDLNKILSITGERKQVLLHRYLRNQKFLMFVNKDLNKREEKRRCYWESCIPEKKILSKEQVEGFFDRLIEDGIKRRERLEQRISEQQTKEDQLIKEMANRVHARKPRPPSNYRRKR